MSESGGGDLFIVDNSVSGWTGLEYLRQWSDLARSFDIATGFFEIGALLVRIAGSCEGQSEGVMWVGVAPVVACTWPVSLLPSRFVLWPAVTM